MTANGLCRYQFNPSELYQRTKHGMGVESHCGSKTFPAVDIPEVYVDGGQFHETGRMVAREHPDPYCPAHGGSPEPPPPPVTKAQLEAARATLADLEQRLGQGQLPSAEYQQRQGELAKMEEDVRDGN